MMTPNTCMGLSCLEASQPCYRRTSLVCHTN